MRGTASAVYRVGWVAGLVLLVAVPFVPGAATAGLSGQLAPYAGATGATGSLNFTNHCALSTFSVLPWVNAAAGTGGFYDSGSARTCAGATSGSSQDTDGWVVWHLPVVLANATDVIEAKVLIQSTVTWNVTAGVCTGVNGTCPTYQELGTWTYFEAWVTITDTTIGKTHSSFLTAYSNGLGYLIYGTCATCRGVAGGTSPTGHVTSTITLAPAVAVPPPVPGHLYSMTVSVEAVSFADALHVGGSVGPTHAEFAVLAKISVPAIQQA